MDDGQWYLTPEWLAYRETFRITLHDAFTYMRPGIYVTSARVSDLAVPDDSGPLEIESNSIWWIKFSGRCPALYSTGQSVHLNVLSRFNALLNIWMHCQTFEFSAKCFNALQNVWMLCQTFKLFAKWFNALLNIWVHCQTFQTVWILCLTFECFAKHLNSLPNVWIMCPTSESSAKVLIHCQSFQCSAKCLNALPNVWILRQTIECAAKCLNALPNTIMFWHLVNLRGLIEDLGKLWGHLKEGFGMLISLYCKLLVQKLEFHQRTPEFPGKTLFF